MLVFVLVCAKKMVKFLGFPKLRNESFVMKQFVCFVTKIMKLLSFPVPEKMKPMALFYVMGQTDDPMFMYGT